MRKSNALAALVLAVALGARAAAAGEVHVAVAANFTQAAKEIAAAFEKTSGDAIVLSFGSSGALYTQISQAAPFEILLSADQDRPKQALSAGLAAAGSDFTYAIGKLVLWSKRPNFVRGAQTLKQGDFSKIATADPKAAPYGEAAIETLRALKVYDALKPKVVQGSSIAQTFQFVDSGNADLGFVALSQLVSVKGGSRWLVAQNLYTPIRQDAVLLKKGAKDPAAAAFLAFLRGPAARAVIAKYGYETAD